LHDVLFPDPSVALQEALMEKYRHCDESISKLLEWIADIEEQLANQDLLKETIEELKNQINDVKVILFVKFCFWLEVLIKIVTNIFIVLFFTDNSDHSSFQPTLMILRLA
jgi:hypothetical protein